jgi:hypothetical protein
MYSSSPTIACALKDDLHDCIASLNPGFSRTARFAVSAASLDLGDFFDFFLQY